jgi:uncharacterized protein DUF3427
MENPMPIPVLTSSSIQKALEELLPRLNDIRAGVHDSTKYDLIWHGHRFPPKVVIRKAVQIEHGIDLPESEFSGGRHAGQANAILEECGFVIVPKTPNTAQLPLELFSRYGRKEIFTAVRVKYDPQQQHLNVGLSPRCEDDGYLIFITLNKEDLDPAHDYDDELFAQEFIWVTRRDATEDQENYVNLRLDETRVSLFVRTNPREEFAYLGELEYKEHHPFKDPATGRSQIRFFWRIRNRLPDSLLQELTFGLPAKRKWNESSSKSKLNGQLSKKSSRAPTSFDELKKAYSYVLGTAERMVVPEHQNYQVRLTKFCAQRGVTAEMEKDFVDVSFFIGKDKFIGEIKVTRNLTLSQAFRSAIGQLLDYNDMLSEKASQMVMFLDQPLDERRLKLASVLHIAVIIPDKERFTLMNADEANPALRALFGDHSPS